MECPECGEEIEDFFVQEGVCPHCGCDLKSGEGDEEEEKAEDAGELVGEEDEEEDESRKREDDEFEF